MVSVWHGFGVAHAATALAKSRPLSLDLRTDFRLCADCVNGLANAMIQESVLSLCRSADEVFGVLGKLVALPVWGPAFHCFRIILGRSP